MIVEKIAELPDSSFAYIEPGGVKDAVGKTAPNVLRHLPYKNANGVVDLDALASALNAVKDTNLPRATQTRVLAKLEAVATRHAEAEGVEKYITHEDGSWKVHAESGKVLGTHPSQGEAQAQLAAIEAGKHDRRKAALQVKAGVKYRMTKPGEERIQCHTCVNYSPNSDVPRAVEGGSPAMMGTCAKVAGQIQPDATCELYESAIAKGGGTVAWPVMPRPEFRGSKPERLAGEKAPNQKSEVVAKTWSDEARAAAAAARAHGYKGKQDNFLQHGQGHYVEIEPSGAWQHYHNEPGKGSGGARAATLDQALGEFHGRTSQELADRQAMFTRKPSKKDARDEQIEWTDDAKAAQKEAEKHGFEEELKTDAGCRMSHKGGTALFVQPSGKWHHSDQHGEQVGTGHGAQDLGSHLGKQADHMGALPVAPATTKPAQPGVPGEPQAAPPGAPGVSPIAQPPGKPPVDPAFDKAYADFKAQVKSAIVAKAGPGSRVQSLLFDKDKYKSAKEAKAWANDHGFERTAVSDSKGQWHVQQADPKEYMRIKTIALTEGVQARVGFPMKTVKAVQRAFFLTASGRLAFKTAEIATAECEPVSDDGTATIFRIKCAGQTFHFAATGETAVYMPSYAMLSKSAWVHIVKAEEQRYTLTVVYPCSGKGEPEPDFHGDVMSDIELEKAAWGYIGKGTDRVGLMHRPGTAGAGKVVESYIWRGPEWKMVDTGGTEQSVSPGDWVMGIVWSPEAWAAIKSGQLTGVSLQGAARKEAF